MRAIGAIEAFGTPGSNEPPRFRLRTNRKPVNAKAVVPQPELDETPASRGRAGDACAASARLPIQTTRFFGRQHEIEQIRISFTSGERKARVAFGSGRNRQDATGHRNRAGHCCALDGLECLVYCRWPSSPEASMLLDEIVDVMHAQTIESSRTCGVSDRLGDNRRFQPF